MTLQDMLDVLRGRVNSTRAKEAVFWFAFKWHAGPGSDLYRIMCETGYDPHFYQTQNGAGKKLSPATEPELLHCEQILGDAYVKAFGVPREYQLLPIKFGTLKENDVVVHGPGRPFICIPAGWPCRVYLDGGELKVPCAEDKTGRAFHSFKIGPDGNVVGFRR